MVLFGPNDDPNDGNGIGSVIREIYKLMEVLARFIFYVTIMRSMKRIRSILFIQKAKTKDLIEACKEILANPFTDAAMDGRSRQK